MSEILDSHIKKASSTHFCSWTFISLRSLSENPSVISGAADCHPTRCRSGIRTPPPLRSLRSLPHPEATAILKKPAQRTFEIGLSSAYGVSRKIQASSAGRRIVTPLAVARGYALRRRYARFARYRTRSDSRQCLLKKSADSVIIAEKAVTIWK